MLFRLYEKRYARRVADQIIIIGFLEFQSIGIDALWKKRGVDIFDPEEFIKGNWSSIDKIHILVIHQGVIDKYNDTHNDREKFKIKWDNEIRDRFPFIIIDSDRGKPKEVEELSAIWVQFSDIGDIIVNQAESSLAKYLLVDILTSLRG